MKSLSFLLLLPCLALACSSESDPAPGSDKDGTPSEPILADGKGDVADQVDIRGPIAFGEDAAVTAAFSEDLSFHGYTLDVRPGAVVSLDVTQKGTSRDLDTTLFVYGPRTDQGAYGTSAIAFDDDSGWGLHSRLSNLTLEAGGTYLVVVGTFNSRGRGNYRLLADCPSGDCAPSTPPVTGACHPAIADAIRACVNDWMADPDYDSSTTSERDLIEQCADAEPVAPAWDSLCAQPSAPADLCNVDYETFATTHIPLCRKELINEYLDGACVFGSHYRDLFEEAAEAIVIVQGRVLTVSSSLTDLEKAQIVDAVAGSTAYDDVTTAEEAFALVDDNEVNQHELWDASNRRAYTVYEVGAGDNSFGMIFEQGTTNRVLTINDGDYVGCETYWGHERRSCASDEDCATGLRCTGVPADFAVGRCIDSSLDTHGAIGSDCSETNACPAGSGLVCGGAVQGQSGLCQPGWMRGTYWSEPALPIPDNSAGGTEAQLLVYGLATVDMDVRMDLVIAHPRVKDLRVTLTNPAGTEVTIFNGEYDGPELALYGQPVIGYPGDESVNGVWRLRAVDTRSGQVGAIGSVSLTITSRWD